MTTVPVPAALIGVPHARADVDRRRGSAVPPMTGSVRYPKPLVIGPGDRAELNVPSPSRDRRRRLRELRRDAVGLRLRAGARASVAAAATAAPSAAFSTSLAPPRPARAPARPAAPRASSSCRLLVGAAARAASALAFCVGDGRPAGRRARRCSSVTRDDASRLALVVTRSRYCLPSTSSPEPSVDRAGRSSRRRRRARYSWTALRRTSSRAASSFFWRRVGLHLERQRVEAEPVDASPAPRRAGRWPAPSACRRRRRAAASSRGRLRPAPASSCARAACSLRSPR